MAKAWGYCFVNILIQLMGIEASLLSHKSPKKGSGISIMPKKFINSGLHRFSMTPLISKHLERAKEEKSWPPFEDAIF